MTKFFPQLTLSNITVWSSCASKPVSSSKIFFRVILGRPTLLLSSGSHNWASWLIGSWHMTSQTKSFSSNDLSETRVRAVDKIVSNFVFPIDILYFPQYTCIHAMKPFLQRFCQWPWVGPIEKDGLDCSFEQVQLRALLSSVSHPPTLLKQNQGQGQPACGTQAIV